MTREGHAVSQFAVSFYAPDSRAGGTAGARAGDREPRAADARAGDLVSEESQQPPGSRRGGEHRRCRAPRREPASESARGCSRRRIAAARAAAPDPARRADQPAARAAERRARRARRASSPSWRRAARDGESRFDALDAELGVAQERHAELDEATLAAERGARRRARRAARARAPGAGSAVRAALAGGAAPASSSARSRPRAQQLAGQSRQPTPRSPTSSNSSPTSRGRRPSCRRRWRRELERETALGEKRSLYDDLSQRLRAADEARLGHEQALQPLRDKVGALQLEEQAAQLGGAQYAEQLDAAGADREAIGRGRSRKAASSSPGCRAGSTRSIARSRRSARSTSRRSRSSARRASARASSTRRTPTCPRR